MDSSRYPHTPTGDTADDFFGTTVTDPYRWLEDPADTPEVRAWITAQSELAAGALGGLDGRDALHANLTGLWDHPRASAPLRRGGRWFQLRNTGLDAQDSLWVMDDPEDEGRLLVDPNTFSDDGTSSLAGASTSPDGRWLAYAISDAGSDWLAWRVRDIETGEDRDDDLRWAKFTSAAWLPDSSGFVYGRFEAPGADRTYDEANTGHQLWLHRLGDPQDADRLILDDPEHPDRLFSPQVTDDDRFLIVTIVTGTDRRTRIWVTELDGTPEVARPGPLLDDFDASYEVIANLERTLLVLTDRDAPRGRIVAIDVDDPAPASWREILPEHPTDTLELAVLVGGRILTSHLADAAHRVSRWTTDGTADGTIDLGDLVSVAELTGRPDDEIAHIGVTSFTAPARVLAHTIATGETREVVAPGLDDDGLATTRVFVDASDGSRVPVFCLHRDGVDPSSGPHPTVIWGYGGFRIPVTPMFRTEWRSWVEAGGVVAVACLRGGGEYGEAWHDAGRLANKQRVFDDVYDIAERLVADGWTTHDQLGITGRSNGGLLAGACLTQRPELFGAAVPEVGVLDMLRFHRFTIGWAWASDYGNAEADAEQFATLRAYSPLHNVRPGTAYPPTLVVTGDHDDRVVPSHSFKFAAALQAAQAGDDPVLLRVEVDTGHGVGKPTHLQIAERADVLAFMAHHLGLDAVTGLGDPTSLDGVVGPDG